MFGLQECAQVEAVVSDPVAEASGNPDAYLSSSCVDQKQLMEDDTVVTTVPVIEVPVIATITTGTMSTMMMTMTMMMKLG